MNRKSLNFILFSVFLLNLNNSIAQNISYPRDFLCDSCSNNLNFRFESSSFFKNNEYESDFATSFTGIGLMLKPSIEYYFGSNTKLNFGAFGLKYSGLNGFSELIPIYQIRHKLMSGLELVLGSLNGNLKHDLAEPFYRFDRYYLNNVEYGLQVLHNSRYMDSDLWLNWEQFIFEGDPFQEQFTIGNHSKIMLLNKNKIQIKADFQLLIYHKGGEIDSYVGPSFYVFNSGYGCDVSFKTRSINYTLRPKYMIYGSQGLPESGENYKPYKNGSGFLFSGDLDHKYFYFESGYWNGNKFISPSGEYLFMSVSESDPNLYQDNRQLIYSKFRLKRHMSNNLKLELRANLYVDIKNNVLPDYSYGVYFIANELFFLKKINKNRSLNP
ncbi:MAG: hypothetical protein CMD18_02875 [Flavobacteriales bacterium]|nr:hypothetical protein [Flavobacteriales bacterium]